MPRRKRQFTLYWIGQSRRFFRVSRQLADDTTIALKINCADYVDVRGVEFEAAIETLRAAIEDAFDSVVRRREPIMHR